MVTGRRGSRGQGLLTILFTDLAGSTALTQRLGDARAQEVVRAHNTIVRREVQSRGGTEIKHTGDGIMATFPSAARAVACAVAIQQGVRTYGEAHPEMAFSVKIGLNAGEPLAEEADVFGTAVQLAARTCAEARAGQILATNVVRELVFGKGALFADAGAAELKGFDEPVRLYEVGVGEAGIDEGSEIRARSVLRWVAAGALAVAIVGAGAVALVVSLGGGEEAGAGDAPPFRELRSHSSAETALTVVDGDCDTADLRLEGVNTGTWAGDIEGSYRGDSIVTVQIAEGCSTTRIETAMVIADDAGNRIEGRALTNTAPRIGDVRGDITAGRTYEVVTEGAVTSGAGLYKDAVGTLTCELIATIQEGLRSRQDGECTVRLFVEEAPHLVIAAGAERDSVGVSLNARQEPDTIRLYGVYFNASGAPIEGARMTIASNDDVEFVIERANPADSDPGSVTGWDIPPIPAGEAVYFDLTLRLRSSQSDAFEVFVEVESSDLPEAAVSLPVALEVVR
jgi:class 3 adenylate cyclase